MPPPPSRAEDVRHRRGEEHHVCRVVDSLLASASPCKKWRSGFPSANQVALQSLIEPMHP